MLHYERAVETKRPAGSRRIEIFSPKIKRRLTLFSWNTHDAWLLLEADPTVRAFCERPAYVDAEAGRVLDFWVDQGSGRAKFLVVSMEDADAKITAAERPWRQTASVATPRHDCVRAAYRELGADRAVPDEFHAARRSTFAERSVRALGEAAPSGANRGRIPSPRCQRRARRIV